MGLDEALGPHGGPLRAGEPVHRLHDLALLRVRGQSLLALAGARPDVEEKGLSARELVGDAVVAVPVLGAVALHVEVPVRLLAAFV